MPIRLSIVLLAIVLFATLFLPVSSETGQDALRAQEHAAGSVSLTLDVDAGKITYPLHTGIPFPQGTLVDTSSLALRDEQGANVAAQFDVLAHWPNQSIKSVLVSFIAEKSASARDYTLAYGPDVRSSQSANEVIVRERGDEVVVDTGAALFEIHKTTGGLFEAIGIDENDSGSLDPDEAIIGGADIYLHDAASGRQFALSEGSKQSFQPEYSGRQYVSFRLNGRLRTSEQSDVHPDDDLTDYIVRLHFYAGLPDVRIEYTLVDTRPERNVNRRRTALALSASEYGIRFSHALADPVYTIGSDGRQPYTGSAADGVSLLQTGELGYEDGRLADMSTSYEGVGEGDRAPGYIQLSSDAGAVSVFVQDFWQQFPGRLSADSESLTVALHAMPEDVAPDVEFPQQEGNRYRRPNTFYFQREGGAKTTRMLLRVSKDPMSEGDLSNLNDRVQSHNLRVTADADWYAHSGVFGDIGAAGRTTSGYDKFLMSGIYQRSFGSDKANPSVIFGWRDYGDRLRPGWARVDNDVRVPAFYNDTHVGANNFITQFVRTLDQRWWNLGVTSTLHFMDIDVSHTDRYGYWDRGRGFTLGPGEPHLRSHANIDHEARSIHFGHAHVSGLPNYYLLTGDRRALEVLEEISNWWRAGSKVFYPIPRDSAFRRVAEAERDFAWPLYSMNEWVRTTSDVAYHREVSAHLVRFLIEWWGTPADHMQRGEVVGTHDASQGTGWWAMDNMDNGRDGKSTGTNPWMAGALISALIQFRELDDQLGSDIDRQVLDTMLLQTMNYVVKYGYSDDIREFVYSEARNERPGGATHIVYPLAYLARLYQAKLAAGEIANPSHYDTVDRWLPLAERELKRIRAGKYRDGSSQGFYGYEMVYPADFFQIMESHDDGQW